ncbi:MAG: hypothetical protein K0R78_3450 [Pelosinus sp.]|nr:hypothetical protein [Pelosinus sp.]
MFEFKKLKLEVAYAMEWISYYLGKYLGGPLSNIKQSLSDLNAKITQTMPEWTKQVAKVLAMIINVGISGVRFVKDLYHGFERFFDMLPRGVSTVAKTLLGLWAVLRFTPIGIISMSIAGLLVLIEDFYGYIDGRKSSKTMAPIWQRMIDWFKEADKWMQKAKVNINNFWDEFKNSKLALTVLKIIRDTFKLMSETVSTLIDLLTEAFTIMAEAITDNGVAQAFEETFTNIAKAIDSVILGLINVMKQLGLLSSDSKYKGFWRWFGNELAAELKRLAAFGNALASIFDIIGLAMQGKYEEAAKRGMSLIPNLIRDIKKSYSSGGGASSQEMMELAKGVSAKTGIPANLIYGQWHHETGGFSSELMKDNNNFAGLTQTIPNGEENKQPDGINYYRKFSSPQEFAEAFAKYIKLYGEDGILDAKTPEEYARALKHGGYMGDSAENYAQGMRNGIDSYTPSAPQVNSREIADSGKYNFNQKLDYVGLMNNARDNYAMMQQNTANVYRQPSTSYQGGQTVINVGDINIAGTNASTSEITLAVTQGINQAQERQIARNMRDLGGVIA